LFVSSLYFLHLDSFSSPLSPQTPPPSTSPLLLSAQSLPSATSSSHPWGLPASDPFNGFALRSQIYKELSEFVASPPSNATSRIIFDDISNSYDGAQNLTMFHEHMTQATFCPQPAGDSPSRRAIYEALLLGCIPVIFRERSYGRLFPSTPEINDMSRYTVYVDENDLIANGVSLIERLEAVSEVDIRRMRRHIQRIASRLQWSIPEEEEWLPAPGHALPAGVPIFNATANAEQAELHPPHADAFSTLLNELAAIRDGDWVQGVARDLRKGMQSFGRAPTTV
jgi:hypothetical protein